MTIRPRIQLLLLLCLITIATYAQDEQSPSLQFGDPAPPLRVREWLKGTPVQRFEKGKVYVLEFWATWCAPCKAAMPHLSALAREYKDRVTIIGVDVKEMKTTSMEKVKAFVDSMGQRMDYHVAAEDSNFMTADWMDASAEQGIPKSFVVNAEGRLAWIGYPKDLDEVLRKIVNKTWNIEEALAKKNWDKRLAKLDLNASYELMKYSGDHYKEEYMGKPDSALIAINEIVSNEPKLKYAPCIASRTFSSLLKIDPHKAYEYGKVVLVTSTYEGPAYDAIIFAVEFYSHKLNLPLEIYRLGAEAYQKEIAQITYPELANMPRLYTNMANMYWRANDQSKAIEAQQKAIEAVKSKQAIELAAFESQLQQYKNK